jgi:Mrp family chromosome partitioning ATPase
MSRADVFRIIDVLAPPEAEQPAVTPPPEDHASPAAQAVLATWDGESAGTAIGPRRSEPIVRVEYLAFPQTADPRLVMLSEPTSDRARSFRLLRHRLLALGDPRVVAVTSARAADGKTTCAANLALAMAEDRTLRVLLLDANLQRPGLGRLFGFEVLSSFMGDVARVASSEPPYSVVGLEAAGLHIAALPALAIPGGRLDRTSFSSALVALRSVYDYIVIDAASVLESGDADVAGECADGVVLATRARESCKTDLRRAIDQLRPTVVLGSVLLDA